MSRVESEDYLLEKHRDLVLLLIIKRIYLCNSLFGIYGIGNSLVGGRMNDGIADM